jgi:hypothetical protein
MSLDAYEIVGEKGLDGGCHIVRMLGQGGFGTVHEVICEDGQVSSIGPMIVHRLTFGLYRLTL